jgi:hypothetical protein
VQVNFIHLSALTALNVSCTMYLYICIYINIYVYRPGKGNIFSNHEKCEFIEVKGLHSNNTLKRKGIMIFLQDLPFTWKLFCTLKELIKIAYNFVN